MTNWDKKPENAPKTDSRRDLDDFWDIERLLPDRPARKAPPHPRQAPSAVDVEVPARPVRGTAASPTAIAPAEPVHDAPLTVHPSDRSAARPAPQATPVPQARPLPQGSPATQTVAQANGEGTVHYVPPHTAEENEAEAPLADYAPDGVLLHRVRVFGWHANYHYFDSFTKDAERYAAMEAPREARKESFFSYFPQYVQMNRRATAWYLYWRERVRHGQYLDTDYAYVLLYLFELINLPPTDAEAARLCRDTMAKVWVAYRRAFPQLDHYMCEWLCDYCLIHRLNAPIDLLSSALDDIIMGSRLKEFYLSAAVDTATSGEGGGLETARILLRHCCQYDYRKSKFAQGEHKALFDRTIPAAVAAVLPLLLGGDGQKPVITMLDSTVTRDAYTGALCSYQNKRKIEVSYTSFSRSHELRFLIGDMVKHTENRLRSWIGVRSRLSVMSLPTPLRDALDAYLNPLAPLKSAIPAKKKEEPRPAYEALYDLPSKPISLEAAAAIEESSWKTTRILVEAFEEADETADNVPLTGNGVAVEAANGEPLRGSDVAVGATNAVAPKRQTEDAESEGTGDALLNALETYLAFIQAALRADSAAQRAAATTLRKMPDAVADEVNNITAESELGDVILEDDGTGLYTVIEDYQDRIREILHLP